MNRTLLWSKQVSLTGALIRRYGLNPEGTDFEILEPNSRSSRVTTQRASRREQYRSSETDQTGRCLRNRTEGPPLHGKMSLGPGGGLTGSAKGCKGCSGLAQRLGRSWFSTHREHLYQVIDVIRVNSPATPWGLEYMHTWTPEPLTTPTDRPSLGSPREVMSRV